MLQQDRRDENWGGSVKLVFLHGAGNSSLSFYYQLRHFRNSKAIDLPGHPTGQPCTSIDAYMEWVRGFNAARRYKDVVLCGHSMGGAITLQYALRYPEELKAIILLGTGAKLRVNPDFMKRCQEAGSSSSNNGAWLEEHQAQYQKVAADLYPVLIQRTQEIGPKVELNDLKACDGFDAMSQVKNIRLPTQVVCGGDDALTPVKYSEYLSKEIKGARQRIIPKGSHFVQLEKFQQVNDAIEEFLATLKG
ncbi:MAG: alpha/beta hydrolase [Dehalococcoidia bacterium]|nr:alpha/beta hydrolase [Dehalococcoidia bacterium]